MAGQIVLLPIGRTDRQGDASMDVRVPNGLPDVTAFLQGLGAELKVIRSAGNAAELRLEFCTSNVVKVTAGRSR